MGEDGEGGVAVPGVVATDLVVVEAGLVPGRLEALLNRPPLMPVKRKLSLARRPDLGRY